MGRTLRAANRTWRITGIVQDVPTNSHLRFDALASMEGLAQSLRESMWLSTNFMTYVKLSPSTDAEHFEAGLSDWVRGYAAPQMEQFFGASFEELEAGGGRYHFFLQPLTDIHLHSQLQYELEANSDIAYVYVFSVIAAFILLIACVNFMNLATARSADRAAEVGMRKALGAQRRQLAGQFVGEAVLTTGGAFLVALVVAHAALPLFNDIAGLALDISSLYNGPVMMGLVGLIAVVGLVAGSYPAFLLSAFPPVAVLRWTSKRTTGSEGTSLRRGLVVLQFTITIALLVGTMVVYHQLDYIQHKNLGYDKERVVLIERGFALGEQQSAFKEKMRQLSSVMSVGASDGLFLGDVSNTTFVPEGSPMSASQSFAYTAVDHDFVETMDIAVTVGRDFSPERPADSTAVLLNQQAVKLLGWTDPVGQRLRMPFPNREDPVFTVIGVVEDFHFQSLHLRIQPLVLIMERTPQYVYARLRPGTILAGVEALRTTWQTFIPEEPFEYTFLDQSFAALHEATQRTGQLFGLFTGIAVLIACLGLFGLATHAAQRRTKEIGIRKALGASVSSIVALLSKEFLVLVTISFVVAVPVAYVAMQQWLQDFAYRVDLSAGLFMLAGGLALAIALGTVSTQALRAARTDPAKALRSE
jgi:putative ABC transport system permease protein